MLGALLPELRREPGPAAVAIANWQTRRVIGIAERAGQVRVESAKVSDLGSRATLFMLAIAFLLLDREGEL